MSNHVNQKKSRLPWLIFIGGLLLLLICCGIVICISLVLPVFRERIIPADLLRELPAAITQETSPLQATLEQPKATEQLVTITPNLPQPTNEVQLNVDYDGIQFYLDAQVAIEAIPERVPASEGDAANAFPGEIHPEYVQFNLQGYPLVDTFHKPFLIVFPALEYAALDPTTAKIILDLRTVLKEKPAQPDSLPFLPRWPAAQFLQAQVRYLDFTSSSGVRFLTQYGQATWPINNHDLFYTFQGLTNDGLWYIAAVMPASHPLLPSNGESVPIGDLESLEQSYETYLSGMEDQLGAQMDDSFTPNLALLDALFQSIRIVSPP